MMAGFKSKNLFLSYLLASAVLILLVNINATLGDKVSESTEKKSPSQDPNKPKSVLKRQAPPGKGSFGFQYTNPTPNSNYYANNNNNYDTLRTNNLNYNSRDSTYNSRDNTYGRDYFRDNRDNFRDNRDNFRDNYRDNYRDSPSTYRDTNRDIYIRDNIRDPYYPSPTSYGSSRSNYYDARDRDRLPYDDYRYRDMAASQQNEIIMRNGQQRHDEYQKRTGAAGGQEFYDPFYFIGMRNSAQGTPLSAGLTPSSAAFPLPPSSPAGLSPSVSTSAVPASSPMTSSSSASAAPLRNRRNSHQRPNDIYNEISGSKYDIMSAKSAYPVNHHNHHHNHRLENHHNSGHNQFLTREQLVRQNPDSRVPYPPNNHIEHYGSSGVGQPWSVRIGTQLKVNDDGRSPNPHRFYVRDEINPSKNRSRYPNPIYRRK